MRLSNGRKSDLASHWLLEGAVKVVSSVRRVLWPVQSRASHRPAQSPPRAAVSDQDVDALITGLVNAAVEAVLQNRCSPVEATKVRLTMAHPSPAVQELIDEAEGLLIEGRHRRARQMGCKSYFKVSQASPSRSPSR